MVVLSRKQRGIDFLIRGWFITQVSSLQGDVVMKGRILSTLKYKKRTPRNMEINVGNVLREISVKPSPPPVTPPPELAFECYKPARQLAASIFAEFSDSLRKEGVAPWKIPPAWNEAWVVRLRKEPAVMDGERGEA